MSSNVCRSTPAAPRFALQHHRRRPSRLLGTPCHTEHRSEKWAIPSLCRGNARLQLLNTAGVVRHIANPRPSLLLAVSFQLRPLPSTGVTRLHRYYEPSPPSIRPGLSLASCQLISTPQSPLGLPVLRMVPFCLHAVANTPAGRMEFVRFIRFPPLRPSP